MTSRFSRFTLLHSFGIEAENFNGVTDKTINNLLA
jgi:hypothetical protein